MYAYQSSRGHGFLEIWCVQRWTYTKCSNNIGQGVLFTRLQSSLRAWCDCFCDVIELRVIVCFACKYNMPAACRRELFSLRVTPRDYALSWQRGLGSLHSRAVWLCTPCLLPPLPAGWFLLSTVWISRKILDRTKKRLLRQKRPLSQRSVLRVCHSCQLTVE